MCADADAVRVRVFVCMTHPIGREPEPSDHVRPEAIFGQFSARAAPLSSEVGPAILMSYLARNVRACVCGAVV